MYCMLRVFLSLPLSTYAESIFACYLSLCFFMSRSQLIWWKSFALFIKQIQLSIESSILFYKLLVSAKTLQHQEAEEYKFSLKTVHNTKKLEYRRVESWNLPLVNGPRSPPRFAELQSLYLLARSSNLSVPDVIRLW